MTRFILDTGPAQNFINNRNGTLHLSYVYAVVAWCLNNDTAVNEYMAGREMAASEIQNELEIVLPIQRDLLKTLTERAKDAERNLAAIGQ